MVREIILLIIATCFLVSCTNKKQNTKTTDYVKVIKAKTFENEVEHKYTFISQPFRMTELSFRVGGPVVNLDVQSGEYFRKGNLIASIDNRDYIIHKERAEAIFIQKESEWKRASNLYSKENISEMSYVKAKAEYLQAKADFNKAVNDFDDTKMYAPFDGYVQKVNIEKFQDVSPSFPILEFIDLSKIKIETYVPENVAMKLNNTNKPDIKINFKSIKERTYAPSELYISKTTSENNISYLLTIIINNTDNELFGGMTGSISIKDTITQEDSRHVAVPLSIVCHNETTGDFVWKVNSEQKVYRSKIVKGNLLKNNCIEILEGVEKGDIIATSRLYSLKENEKVNFMEEEY